MAGNSVIIQPDTQYNIVPAQTTASNSAQKVLLVAQKTAAGSAVSGALSESVSTANNDIDSLLGARSMAAQAARTFRKINKVSQLDVIALTDAAGTAATSVITFTNAATAAGTLTIEIGSSTNHTITYAIADADTPTLAGDSLAAAITADTRVPCTAVNAVGVVTLTAANVGTEGNDITVKISGTVAGLTVALTSGFSGGATNPALTGLFDIVGDNRYQTVIWPDSYGLAEIKAFLDPRFNAGNQILDGVAIMTKTDTYSNLVSAATSENSQSMVIEGFSVVTDADYKGSSMLELGIVVSASLAAIRSMRLTQDANVSQYVISTGGAKDSFGGPHMASFPYFNTPFPYLPLIPAGKGFNQTEIEGLVAAGVSTIGNNTAGNTVISGEQVTTYKTDSAGNTDISFKYLNYVDTSSASREFFQNNMKARFGMSRLTNGDLKEGHSMANEGTIRAFGNGLYDTLSDTGYVLTEAGSAAQKYYNDNLVIAIDTSLGKATINQKIPIVTQFRTIVATHQISFSTEG
ncbi:MAG: hypothetical protein OEM38_00485 [Gammaproteobacteria bacterium]|nr:hypothetical protein [Gammaproteobacteria bacterium]